MGLKCKVDTEATLDHLSVGIVRRWLSSDSGMYCAITQYKHNRMYVTKLHRCTLSPFSLCLTHIGCHSNNHPVPPTVPLLPTEYRVERLYPPWINVPVTSDPRDDLGWLLIMCNSNNWHGFWVHGEQLDGITHLLQCSLEQPQGGLATATGHGPTVTTPIH